ncbi:guanine nucleotide-binding protein subunit gamma 4-like isoform X1 [Aristolochia californica]|uniref:guanine nucleotide-binding protein subunit gamma 4-like isoform X1 n=1 Tax=Aristolochia californica TaxID=171875 RepID=UPI0035DBC500
MANSSPRYAAPSPLSIPAPRSPPKYPDLCGRHRKQAELQVLNREIGFLEEDLQFLDTLHPASKCCKEIDEFVGKNQDPLIPLNLKVHRSARIWKWLCSKTCWNFSWLCCCNGCSLCQRPKCNCNSLKNCHCCCSHHCCRCRCRCRCCCQCHCCNLESSSFRPCCHLPKCSCSPCCCSCSCEWCFYTCNNVGNFCPTCKEKPLCLTCFLCF